SPETNLYYTKKYTYLKKIGFFKKTKNENFGTLEESVVMDNIINAKQIVFETTDCCNLKCLYCAQGEWYNAVDERKGKKINIHYAINLLKYIFDIKSKNENSKFYISFYGGEALLNMNFIKQIVEVANQLNAEKELELLYSMTTNATLIHKHIEFLVEHKFSLLISLDGNEKNHSYRIFSKNKKNSFQKVIENVDMIQRNYPEYFSTYVNFNSVLHNRNSVKEIYEFIYSRYNKIPRIAELNMRDVRIENKDMLEKLFHRKWDSEVEYQKEESGLFHMTHGKSILYKELTNFLKFCSVNYYISNVNAMLPIEEKYLPTGTCTPFSKKIFLTNRNKLLPCERINYKYSLGKVDNNIEINVSEITRQYNFYYDQFKKKCKTCYAYRFCGVCLFQINNIDKMGTDEFFCDNFIDQKAFKNKLYFIFSFLEKYPDDFSQILENLILE
ncbi:radical SAM peptide maturase, partial [Parabacteroides sp. OttesenSCG-928-G21]|nr:radical SAM peptide maturase [Parabacteroides sp. OttesenSCG-928-G21]